MAYSVDWLTKIVTVPKADLTLVSASPEIYELDVNDFWLEIHDIQDDFVAVGQDQIMTANAPTSFAPRGVDVVNGYSIEFEDGQYTVQLKSANSTIQNNAVQNQVSIRDQTLTGSGLDPSVSERLSEIWQRLGLDATNPMTSTNSQISVGDITIDLTGDGTTTSTATRQ